MNIFTAIFLLLSGGHEMCLISCLMLCFVYLAVLYVVLSVNTDREITRFCFLSQYRSLIAIGLYEEAVIW